jgi:pimeloyl-ACP methyl ester carboxylesterase
MKAFTFPVGYHNLHKIKIIDYQLNRWHSFGYVPLADMQAAAAQIKRLDDWKGVMVRQADKALAEGRLMSGTFLTRAAEFFTHHTDPDKDRLYDKFIDLFYNKLFVDEPIERYQVPYGAPGGAPGGVPGGDVYLPALRLPPQSGRRRGTIVMHGGFDSFIEELFSWGCHFANLDYEVILFEGPGQGAALKKHGLPIAYEWEKPAKAILDFFELDDVTWLGVSMGGWFCFRAAAYEPRIKRVIASSIAYDYMRIPPKFVADFARWLMKYPGLMNKMSAWKMKMMPQEKWGIDNLMYISHTDTPLAASQAILQFNEQNLKSWLVQQDVLILTGEEDHFIPLKMHHIQVEALTQAKSVTGRIFTRAEQGHNHCQVGNMGLALAVMAEWLAEKETAGSEKVFA